MTAANELKEATAVNVRLVAEAREAIRRAQGLRASADAARKGAVEEKGELARQASQEVLRARRGAELLTEQANANYVREAAQVRAAIEHAPDEPNEWPSDDLGWFGSTVVLGGGHRSFPLVRAATPLAL